MLPKAFAIKHDDSDLFWEFIKWINKEYKACFNGDSHGVHYGVYTSGRTGCTNVMSRFGEGAVILTPQEWKSLLEGNDYEIY